MSGPTRAELIQLLLESTNLPKDVIQHIIVQQALYLPDPQIARSKFKAVVRSLNKLKGCICHYCGNQKGSVAWTDPRNSCQPFWSSDLPSAFIPFCQDCKPLHCKQLDLWNRCKVKSVGRRHHIFQQFNPKRHQHEIDAYVFHLHALGGLANIHQPFPRKMRAFSHLRLLGMLGNANIQQVQLGAGQGGQIAHGFFQ